MMGISEYQLQNKLKYHRKVHIFDGLYLVSLYSSKGDCGYFVWNLHNIFLFPLTFLFLPIRVYKNRREKYEK